MHYAGLSTPAKPGAQVAEIPGAISQGRTRDEARTNVINALDVLLNPDEQLAGQPEDSDSESITLTVVSTDLS